MTLGGVDAPDLTGVQLPNAKHYAPKHYAPHRSSLAEEATFQAYVLTNLAAWYVVLFAWSRLGYVCSFEWTMLRLLRKDPANMGAEADASQHGLDEERVGASVLARWSEWCAVQVQLRTYCWLPSILWTLLATKVLAPHVDDFHHKEGLAHALRGPTDQPKLFGLFVLVYYLLPCAVCTSLAGVLLCCGAVGGSADRPKRE